MSDLILEYETARARWLSGLVGCGDPRSADEAEEHVAAIEAHGASRDRLTWALKTVGPVAYAGKLYLCTEDGRLRRIAFHHANSVSVSAFGEGEIP